MHPHFAYADKPSALLVDLVLTEHDYDNMHYIIRHRDIFNALIKKYSSLNVEYPELTDDYIHNIPTLFSLHCVFDKKKDLIVINEKLLSPQSQFVLLYMKTLELVQICIDIYNEFERTTTTQQPLIPLKNGVAFI